MDYIARYTGHSGNNTKGQILKWVFQEDKARQFFPKTNISYPMIRTRTRVYQGVTNVCFPEILAGFVFLKHSLWDSPFCLITNPLRYFLDKGLLNSFHHLNHSSIWRQIFLDNFFKLTQKLFGTIFVVVIVVVANICQNRIIRMLCFYKYKQFL